MTAEIVYLDHAAATPIDRRVVAAMQPYFSECFFNPSSPYAPAVTVRQEYDAAKQTIARTIGASADEIIMTAGATESINLAFHGVVDDNAHVVTVAIEHHAVLAAAKQYDHTIVAVDERGMVSSRDIAQAITPATQLVSIALANNEIGTIQPLREIAQVLKQIRASRLEQGNATPIFLHSDASQGVGVLDVHVGRLGIDLLTINAAKIYGPKQVGLLYVSRHIQVLPSIVGGGQERGLRSGTENVAGTVGFACAMQLASKHRTSESERLRGLRDELERTIISRVPSAVVSGHKKHRLPGHLHVSFPYIDAERLVFALEAQQVLVATGSACAANKGTRSHVLEAIGLGDATADGSLRISLGALSTPENTRQAAEYIIAAVEHEIARGHS
ncbi:MAG: cysteine desulfurase family protein [Candidatus Saccharimonadales bacterium]